MGKFSEQHAHIQETKEKNKFAKELLAKSVANLGVVSYTGLFIGSVAAIIQGTEITSSLFIILSAGILLTLVLFYTAYKISKLQEYGGRIIYHRYNAHHCTKFRNLAQHAIRQEMACQSVID